MKTPLRSSLALTLLLLPAGRAAADPPPSESELKKLLADEPVNQANWWKWSPWLRAWSGEHFQSAWPAFQQALKWVKDRHQLTGGRPNLPKDLQRDAVAWMLLAGAYLHDT